jgi:peptidyl-prolyl cis-trans isomerase C
MKKYIIAMTAIVVVLLAGALTYKVHAEKNNGIAAVVNGEQITVADIKEAYEQNPQIKAQVPFEEFYAHALDVMVNSKLALQAATKDNIQATPEYQKQLAELQDEVARQVYLEKKVNERLTDDVIQKEYDAYVAKFEGEQEVKAKHILVESEDLAKEIITKLDNGEKFDDLARQYSKDQPELGYFTAKMMVPEFSEAAFNMEKGTYSKAPVKTEFGYHIIFIEDTRTSEPLPFENIKDQLKAILAQQAVADIIKEMNDSAQIEKYDLDGKKIETK